MFQLLPKSYNAECCVRCNSTEFFQIVLLIVCQMVTIPQYTINCRKLNYFHVDTKVTLIKNNTSPWHYLGQLLFDVVLNELPLTVFSNGQNVKLNPQHFYL